MLECSCALARPAPPACSHVCTLVVPACSRVRNPLCRLRTPCPARVLPRVTIVLLMATDLRLCDTHFPTTSELSQFVLASPTAKRRMLEPLASVLREGFRKRGQRDFRKRRYISKQERNNNSSLWVGRNDSQYITLGREKRLTVYNLG